MDRRKRFLAIGLIGIGIIMIFGQWINFMTLVALFLLGYGIFKVRQGEDVKTGYILMAIGGIFILLDHFMLVIAILMISLGFYYAKMRKNQPFGNMVQKQSITTSLRWDLDPWTLRNTCMWHILGEIDIDLSLAIMEGKDNLLIFQGIVGDVDLSVFDDYGVEIEAFVLFGQVELGQEKDTGIMNRVNWKSPDYELHEHKVKIMLSYLVGDIEIKFS